MIKSNELRIGNIVNHLYNTIQIESVFGDSVNVSAADMGGGAYIEGIDCKDIEPILVTPEWLEKLGAKGFENKENLYCQIGLIVFRRNPEFGLCIWDAEDDQILFGTIHYKYVHQLQNLYFALTGEELETKK